VEEACEYGRGTETRHFENIVGSVKEEMMKQMADQHLESFNTGNSPYWKAEDAIWTLGCLAAACSAAPAEGVSLSP